MMDLESIVHIQSQSTRPVRTVKEKDTQPIVRVPGTVRADGGSPARSPTLHSKLEDWHEISHVLPRSFRNLQSRKTSYGQGSLQQTALQPAKTYNAFFNKTADIVHSQSTTTDTQSEWQQSAKTYDQPAFLFLSASVFRRVAPHVV